MILYSIMQRKKSSIPNINNTRNILLFMIILVMQIPVFELSIANQLPLNFFPLKTGNSYTFDVHQGSHPFTWHTRERLNVSSETFINGKKYFFLDNEFPDHYNNAWVRWDSVTGSLYKFDSLNSCSLYLYEKQLDSFDVNLNDTVRNCSSPPFHCTERDTVNIFGIVTAERKFYYVDAGFPFGWEWQKTFAENFGMVFYARGSAHAFKIFTLTGCVLNGVVYGDTVVGIKQTSNLIPEEFKLYQNYPNPFNPVTTIKFDLLYPGKVKLKIYSSGGKEIYDLFNEYKATGSYEIKFDASELPSGIYFYQLSTGNNTFTKKMILIK